MLEKGKNEIFLGGEQGGAIEYDILGEKKS